MIKREVVLSAKTSWRLKCEMRGKEKGKRLVWKLIRWLNPEEKPGEEGSLALRKDSLCIAKKGEILRYKMPSNRCYSIKSRWYYFEEFSSTAYKNSCVFDGISARTIFALQERL